MDKLTMQAFGFGFGLGVGLMFSAGLIVVIVELLKRFRATQGRVTSATE